MLAYHARHATMMPLRPKLGEEEEEEEEEGVDTKRRHCAAAAAAAAGGHVLHTCLLRDHLGHGRKPQKGGQAQDGLTEGRRL